MKDVLIFLKKYKYVVIGLLCVFQVFLIIFFQRGIFFQKYDLSYWKDRFEHSQWRIPESQRSIGDDGLYEYVGYTLATGADLASVNAEMPPVGKYLIGFSIVMFDNPFVYTFLISVACLAVFFFLCKLILKNTFYSFLCTFFLFLDPLFYSQMWVGTLDSTQLFFLLSHVLFLFLLVKQKGRKYLFAILSGISLGLFVEVKPPVLLPMIFLLDLWYLLKQPKKTLVIFLLSIGIGGFIPYSYFFLSGHSLQDFIHLQKYMIGFYRSSKLPMHFGAIFITFLIGKFPDIVSGVLQPAHEWWLVWPVLLIVGICLSLGLLLKKISSREEKMIALLSIGTLIVFSFVPFYTRYILPVLPFLYLLVLSSLFTKTKQVLKVGILILIGVYGFVHTVFLLHPDYHHIISAFSYNFSHGFFQDVYQEDITEASIIPLQRGQFYSIVKGTLIKNHILTGSVTFEPQTVSFFAQKADVPVTIVYTTLTEKTIIKKRIIHLVQENGQWKVQWDWGLLPNERSL